MDYTESITTGMSCLVRNNLITSDIDVALYAGFLLLLLLFNNIVSKCKNNGN